MTFVSTFVLNSHFFLYFRKIIYNDLVAITPEQYFKQITKRVAEIKAVSVSVATEASSNSRRQLILEDKIDKKIIY